MVRSLRWSPIVLVLLAAPLAAQDGIQQGKIKKFDSDKKIVTIASGGKEREYVMTKSTTVRSQWRPLGDLTKELREGVDVKFKVAQQNGEEVLVGLMILGGAGGARPDIGKLPDTSALKPLTELGKEKYQGFEGGLYPDGKNERPAAHDKAGLALARKIEPLDAAGKPSSTGKIVLLTIGMSNTSQASQGFQQNLAKLDDRNPRLVLVNGSVGGMVAVAMADPDPNKGVAGKRGADYWKQLLPDKLKAAEVTAEQVQAIWIKQADAGPSEGFPGYAKKLESELEKIVQSLPGRFPNLRLVYLSSRTYGGFAKTLLNPDPYAYESGFSVKWLIEKQIQGDPALNFDASKGAVKAPWLSWGPYLWANGTTKRADGSFYEPGDFAPDGTHHAASGVDKIGRQLVEFFKTDSTTRLWFLRPTSP